MNEFDILESSVGLVTLKMKIGIGAGALLAARVGGVDQRWEHIIAGEALFQAHQAERQAQQGDIVLSPQAQEAMPDSPTPPSQRLLNFNWHSVEDQDAVQALLRCYIPKPVLSWLDEELHGWLATLRPMSVLFVGIKGLDYDQPDGVKQLHHFTQEAQKIVYSYQGSLPRISVDDKGTALLVLFGAPPYSHEDDPERAVRCALALQQVARRQNLQLAIGVTTGRVFAGPVGGFTRREYTVMGDTVNLAARLMSQTSPGQISCNYETYRSTYDQLSFDLLPPIKVKGKSEAVQVYRPTGDRRLGKQLKQITDTDTYLPFVGRENDLNRLMDNLKALESTHRGRVVVIEGEAGIGKSQLVKKLVRRVKRHQVTLLLGVGRSIQQTSPFRAWQDIFLAYFKKFSDNSSPPSHLESQLKKTAPHLVDALSKLHELLTNGTAGSESQRSSTPKPAESEKLAELLPVLLQIIARDKPLLLVFEDAQWLDDQSWRLVIEAARQIVNDNLPVMLLVVMRPFEESQRRFEINNLLELPHTENIRLEAMPAGKILTLVAKPFGLTRNELPEAAAELIRNRAGGNPFFAEELFYALHQNGFITFKSMQDKMRCLVIGELERAAQTLPATIQNVILARIDQLPPEKQLVLKVAAVIGQVFAYTLLHDTLSEHLDIDEPTLETFLEDLIYLGLIRLETAETLRTYSFTHTIIREVAYQSTLFDRRRQLHRTIAQWYEKTYSHEQSQKSFTPNILPTQRPLITRSLPPSFTPLAPHYALLVYHWHQAEDEEKEQAYAALIAEQAVAQFANAEALGYLNRAIDLTPKDNLKERYKLLLARELVFDRRGDRERQEIDLKQLNTLAQQMDDPIITITVALRQADFAEATGCYSQAVQAAKAAIQQAKQANLPTGEGEGCLAWAKALIGQGEYQQALKQLDYARRLIQTSRLHHTEADILLRTAQIHKLRGQYPEAETVCQKALTLCRSHRLRLLEANCLGLLGQIQLDLGREDTGLDYLEQAMPIYYGMGQRREEGALLASLGVIRLQHGQYEAARDYFEHSLDIARQTGDEARSAVALAHLGTLYCTVGHFTVAQGYLGQALGIYKEIGNRRGEAELLSKFGWVYYNMGEPHTTKRYCNLALTTQQEMKVLADESDTQTYLGHALTALREDFAATIAYERALHLRRQTGQIGTAITPMTGLASVYLAQDDLGQALATVDEILEWMESIGAGNIDTPFWVYHNLYQILQAEAQRSPDYEREAQRLLKSAYELIQEYANQISDANLKRRFLTKVAANKAIIALWDGSNDE